MTGEDRFIPHGATCEADKGMPDCTVECGARAVGLVHDRGRDRYVCHNHLAYWLKAHPRKGDPMASDREALATAIAQQFLRRTNRSPDVDELAGLIASALTTARAQAFEEAAQESDRYFTASGCTRTDTIRLSELRQWLHARATPTGEHPHG